VPSPKTELDRYVEALRARQRPATGAQLEELRRRWEAADRHWQDWKRGELEEPGPGVLRVVRSPPAWELLAVEFDAESEPDEDAEPAGRATRPLSALSAAERERLEGQVARHVATGTPSIHGIAKRFNVSRRQVRNRIAAVKGA
jgi:hypothetical protein